MKPRALSTRGLTEGALLAGLVAVLALAAVYVPLLGAAAVFLVPLPLTVLVIRQGLRTGLLATVVAGVIAAMIAGPLPGMTILLSFAPLGLIVGLGVRQGRSASTIFAMAAGVAVVSLALDLGLTLALSGVNPYRAAFEAMPQQQEAVLDFYRRIGIPVDTPQAQQLNRQMLQVMALMPRLIPLLVVIGGIVGAWMNYEVGRRILARLGYTVPALPPASLWTLPPVLLWLYPLGVALLAISGSVRGPSPTLSDQIRSSFPSGSSTVATAGLNLVMLTQVLFAFQGVLVAWVLLKRYVLLPFVRVLILTFLLLNPMMSFLVVLTGMAESIFRLRQRFGGSPVPARSA